MNDLKGNKELMLKSALLTVLILTMILGLSIVPLRACEYSSWRGDQQNTVRIPNLS